MSGWLSRTVYKICYNKDWKFLAADLKTKMDYWEFAGEWRRENKTHVHVTHNKHTLIWSHTDTHSSLRPQNHLWVLLKASDQHTLRPASSCHWSGPSRVLLLLVFLPVQVSGGSTVCLNCWNSAEIPAAAAGWRLITCREWCHLNHYLVDRLATGWPCPSYAAFKACGRDETEGITSSRWFHLEEGRMSRSNMSNPIFMRIS